MEQVAYRHWHGTLGFAAGRQERILNQEDVRKRFVPFVTRTSKLISLCATVKEAIALRDENAFYLAIQAAIRQLTAKAIVANEDIIDVFTAAGPKCPGTAILDDRFQSEIRGLQRKNEAAELLAKRLRDGIEEPSKRNVVQAQLFSERFRQVLNRYHNRAIATQQVVEERIRLAKDLNAATKRGEDLGLNLEKLAFYDALATNNNAKAVLGDSKLKVVAGERIHKVRKSDALIVRRLN